MLREWQLRRLYAKRHKLLEALRSIEHEIDVLQEPELLAEEAIHNRQMELLDDIAQRINQMSLQVQQITIRPVTPAESDQDGSSQAQATKEP